VTPPLHTGSVAVSLRLWRPREIDLERTGQDDLPYSVVLVEGGEPLELRGPAR